MTNKKEKIVIEDLSKEETRLVQINTRINELKNDESDSAKKETQSLIEEREKLISPKTETKKTEGEEVVSKKPTTNVESEIKKLESDIEKSYPPEESTQVKTNKGENAVQNNAKKAHAVLWGIFKKNKDTASKETTNTPTPEALEKEKTRAALYDLLNPYKEKGEALQKEKDDLALEIERISKLIKDNEQKIKTRAVVETETKEEVVAETETKDENVVVNKEAEKTETVVVEQEAKKEETVVGEQGTEETKTVETQGGSTDSAENKEEADQIKWSTNNRGENLGELVFKMKGEDVYLFIKENKFEYKKPSKFKAFWGGEGRWIPLETPFWTTSCYGNNELEAMYPMPYNFATREIAITQVEGMMNDGLEIKEKGEVNEEQEVKVEVAVETENKTEAMAEEQEAEETKTVEENGKKLKKEDFKWSYPDYIDPVGILAIKVDNNTEANIYLAKRTSIEKERTSLGKMINFTKFKSIKLKEPQWEVYVTGYKKLEEKYPKIYQFKNENEALIKATEINEYLSQIIEKEKINFENFKEEEIKKLEKQIADSDDGSYLKIKYTEDLELLNSDPIGYLDTEIESCIKRIEEREKENSPVGRLMITHYTEKVSQAKKIRDELLKKNEDNK